MVGDPIIDFIQMSFGKLCAGMWCYQSCIFDDDGWVWWVYLYLKSSKIFLRIFLTIYGPTLFTKFSLENPKNHTFVFGQLSY